MKFCLTPGRIIGGAVIALVLGFFCAFGFNNHKNYRPQDMSVLRQDTLFPWLVCDSVPPSVNNFKAGGIFIFSGHSLSMSFNITPADFDTLIKSGDFKPIKEDGIPESSFMLERKQLANPEFYKKRSRVYDQSDQVIVQVILMTSTNHNQVFIESFTR